MAISKIGGISLSSISKIEGMNKANIYRVSGVDIGTETISYVQIPNSGNWWLSFYIYYDGIGYIWDGYGSDPYYLAKIDPDTMNIVGTVNVGEYQITNKVNDGTYLYIGGGGSLQPIFKVRMSDLQLFTSPDNFGTPNGIQFDGSNVWVGASLFNKLNPNDLSILNTYSIDSSNGGVLFDGTYFYHIVDGGSKYIYKSNLSGQLVGALSMPYSYPQDNVQGSTALLKNGYIWVVGNDYRIYKVNTNTLSIKNSWAVPNVYGITSVGNYLYASVNSSPLSIQKFDISNGNLVYVSQWYNPDSSVSDYKGLTNNGTYLFVVCTKSNIRNIMRKRIF